MTFSLKYGMMKVQGELIMPLYEFVCPDCNKTQTVIRSVAERNTMVICDSCGAEMKRRLTATAIRTCSTNKGKG